MAEAGDAAQTSGENNGLFTGLKFWLARRVPMRNTYVESVQQHGGSVVPLEKHADVLIADHLRSYQPEEAISYQWIEKCIAERALVDKNEFRCNKAAGVTQPLATARPAKSSRKAFTVEDDIFLHRWLQDHNISKDYNGNQVFKEVQEHNNRHPWHSWRDRYIKRIRDHPPKLPPAETTSVDNAPIALAYQSKEDSRDDDDDDDAAAGKPTIDSGTIILVSSSNDTEMPLPPMSLPTSPEKTSRKSSQQSPPPSTTTTKITTAVATAATLLDKDPELETTTVNVAPGTEQRPNGVPQDPVLEGSDLGPVVIVEDEPDIIAFSRTNQSELDRLHEERGADEVKRVITPDQKSPTSTHVTGMSPIPKVPKSEPTRVLVAQNQQPTGKDANGRRSSHSMSIATILNSESQPQLGALDGNVSPEYELLEEQTSTTRTRGDQVRYSSPLSTELMEEGQQGQHGSRQSSTLQQLLRQRDEKTASAVRGSVSERRASFNDFRQGQRSSLGVVDTPVVEYEHPFSREDKNWLLGQALVIQNISVGQYDQAWDEFARENPEHTALEWRHFYETIVLPDWKATQSIPSRPSSLRNSLNPSEIRPPVVDTPLGNLPVNPNRVSLGRSDQLASPRTYPSASARAINAPVNGHKSASDRRSSVISESEFPTSRSTRHTDKSSRPTDNDKVTRAHQQPTQSVKRKRHLSVSSEDSWALPSPTKLRPQPIRRSRVPKDQGEASDSDSSGAMRLDTEVNGNQGGHKHYANSHASFGIHESKALPDDEKENLVQTKNGSPIFSSPERRIRAEETFEAFTNPPQDFRLVLQKGGGRALGLDRSSPVMDDGNDARDGDGHHLDDEPLGTRLRNAHQSPQPRITRAARDEYSASHEQELRGKEVRFNTDAKNAGDKTRGADMGIIVPTSDSASSKGSNNIRSESLGQDYELPQIRQKKTKVARAETLDSDPIEIDLYLPPPPEDSDDEMEQEDESRQYLPGSDTGFDGLDRLVQLEDSSDSAFERRTTRIKSSQTPAKPAFKRLSVPFSGTKRSDPSIRSTSVRSSSPPQTPQAMQKRPAMQSQGTPASAQVTEKAERLWRFKEEQLKRGTKKQAIQRALFSTMDNINLARRVIEALSEDDRLPNEQGVWTAKHDQMLRTPKDGDLMKLRKLHGLGSIDARREWLARQS